MTELILAFVGSFCGGIFFNVRKGSLFWTGFSGAAGWLAYLLVHNATGHLVLSIFAGAIIVGFFSEGAARIFKSPSTIYSIPGIFPLVPGIPAYESIQYMVENQLLKSASKAIEALEGASAIACGILFATAIFRIISRMRSKSDSYYRED